jgi:hypothetical protein
MFELKRFLMHSFFGKAVVASAGLLLVVALFGRSVGGAAGADATTQEGCLTQWMFNGIWRVQATKVEPLMDGAAQVGWKVTEIWRNGTSQEISPGDSLLKDQVLGLADGSSIAASTTNLNTMSMGVVASHTFAQAAQFTYVQEFRSAAINPAVKPKTLTITFDGNRLPQFTSKPQFSTHKYNYLIKLDCQATGAQAAQGGIYEIKAVSGCLNQWMSNGVWRMRVTAIGPDNNNDPSGPQIGWMVTEDWVSLVNRPIAPGDTNVTDQQIVLTSSDTIASSNSAGTQMNFGQLVNRTFAPGSSFTYQQRFRQANLNFSDKPVKLIVTFDAVKEKTYTHAPQYTANPPNFRISFDCTK